MLRINEVCAGNSCMVVAFGAITAGIIIDVDEDNDSFTYISDDNSEQETINLGCIVDSKVPGNRYDVHKHGNVVIANFRSWQSGKYYAC